MQDNTSAFYKRVGALGAATALAVSGAFIASPAIASPSGEPDAASTEAPETTATEAPASEPVADETVADEETAPEEAVTDEAESTEEAGTLPPGLAEALLRDLGMTVEEFEAAGELGKKAADALPELQATEGFAGIAIEDGKIVITGSGEALEALALKLDATLVAPAETEAAKEAPAEESPEAPSAEATEEAPAEQELVAPLSLPSDPYAATRALSAHYIANVGVQGLQSVMWDGAGYVISVNKSATIGDSILAKNLAEVAGTPADSYAAVYAASNIRVVDASGPAESVEEVVSGQGYVSFTTPTQGDLCSIGFNGFNKDGDPAVITAGHCARDGVVTEALLTDPTGDEASGTDDPSVLAELGTWGFSQFGGTNNTPGNPDTAENVGTDIAVIDDIQKDLDLLPEVTQWVDAKDLTADTVRITGTADAVVGAPSCKSGRTTGWSCGTVEALGIFWVGGHNMASDPDDVRGVLGFASELDVNALPGDSGGPTISGSNAVGINSAVGNGLMFSTSLSDGLSYLDGYSVAVYVDAPKLTSHENKGTVLTDEAIRGTATTSKVKLTRGSETIELNVVDGAWSFPAPSTVPADGKLEFKVQAVNGFNKSKTASYELTVKEAPLAAPVITNPADKATIADSFQTVTGTGVAGAEVTVTVSGNSSAEEANEDTATTLAAVAETETATVADDGTWDVKLDEALTYGTYSVSASQDGIAGKSESPKATAAFSVILEKAAITSDIDGKDFAEGSNPTKISGTGTTGAEVVLQLAVDGTNLGDPIAASVGVNGDWEATGLPILAPGAFSLTAVQNLGGAVSEPSVVNFTVTAVVIEPEAPPVVPGPTPAPQPGDPTPTPTPTPAPDNNGDGLPDTGAAGMGMFAGAGALLTAGGISALLINRRRQMQDA